MNTSKTADETAVETDIDVSSGVGKGLANQAYEALVDLIFSRELQQGDQIQERMLALRLGISRTPLRAAMHRLEGERVLERRNGRLVVRMVTLQEIMEALHVRRLLESEAAARSAGKVPRETLAAMRLQIETLMSLDDAASPEHQKLDADLHGAVIEWCGNQMLGEMIAEVRRKTRMFSLKRLDNRLGPVCVEHLAIIDALERGDSVAAAAETARHIDNIRQSIIDKLTR
ncbi:GntR family transcriptional regulator [Xylophilus sp. GOD-11R]|uniref:GntR family transcriptional regulator n=1 Tax=Xylophilus sp. GOD-11R TaxID=3089814 RepID=UPI00298C0CDC|nr:GntR family transcriptional regulator [Xylophilus sp. GOD-11R]WPB55643.1 GntR family transcriptional regulator [Xylophilus sp. GOD-11R]